MKIKFCYLITFVFLLITAGTGAAGTITVDNRGADYASIQEAVDNAAAGDSILVYPGTYEENVNVNKELTIRSYSGNPDDTIILAANSMNDVFYVTGNNVTISGFQISGADIDEYGEDKAGVYLEGSNRTVISGNNISSNSFGIFILESPHNSVFDNNVSRCRIGIFLWNSSNNSLNNNILNLNNHEGILLYEFCNNNELSNNTENRAGSGIGLEFFCNNNTLVNNTASNNLLGILLRKSNHNSLIDNSANSNEGSGITLDDSSNNVLFNNTANSNTYSGIFLIGSSDNKLGSNNASNNPGYGINVNNSSRNNVLVNNVANSNGKEDIIFADPENNTIKGPIEDVPFPGFALAVAVVLLASLIFGRKMRGKSGKITQMRKSKKHKKE